MVWNKRHYFDLCGFVRQNLHNKLQNKLATSSKLRSNFHNLLRSKINWQQKYTTICTLSVQQTAQFVVENIHDKSKV